MTCELPNLLTRHAVLLCVASLATGATADDPVSTGPKVTSVEVSAPFEMPPVSYPDFTGLPLFPITGFGAEADDQPATSQAIADAIAAANAAGGGTVVIPAGEWPSGPIHFRDNVELRLEEGAVLRFSPDPADYLPAVHTTWEGMECFNYSPLVYAYGCKNIAITGSGKLHARLDTWKVWYARPKPHMDALAHLYEMASTGVPVEERQMAQGEANLRPQFIQFNRCENVLLEGVSIQNSPFWVIHPYLSKNVVIRGVGVNARGHNNDGVDPDMSQNVLIEDCDFNQGDDAIAIKAGRNQDAWRLGTPCRNIVVRNCRVRNGHQLVAIGSELSGGVENVLVEDCSVDERVSSLGHLLFIKTNERRGGYVRNVHMRRVTAGNLRYGVLGVETDVLYQWRDLVPTHEVRLTEIRDVFLEDIRVGSVDFVSRIQAQAQSPVSNVALRDVTVTDLRGFDHKHEHTRDFRQVPKTRVANRGPER